MGRGRGEEKEVTTAATTSREPRANNKFVGSEFFVLFLCVLAFAAFAPFTPGFASTDNIWNILIFCLPLLLANPEISH